MARKSRGGTRTTKSSTQQKRKASTLPARPVQPTSNLPANAQKPSQALANNNQPGLFGQVKQKKNGIHFS